MKPILKKCHFDRRQDTIIATGIAIGSTMGAAQDAMGFWLGVGSAIGLDLAMARGARNDR